MPMIGRVMRRATMERTVRVVVEVVVLVRGMVPVRVGVVALNVPTSCG